MCSIPISNNINSTPHLRVSASKPDLMQGSLKDKIPVSLASSPHTCL
jgi:hypothetical protein